MLNPCDVYIVRLDETLIVSHTDATALASEPADEGVSRQGEGDAVEPVADSKPTESVSTGGRPPVVPAPGEVAAKEGGGRSPNFDERLAALCLDSDVRRFAMRLARNRELAEDAIQEVYWALARTADPGGIDDLRRYFCAALQHMVRRLLKQSSTSPTPAGDMDAARAAQAGGGRRGVARCSPCEESVVRTVQVSAWLLQLNEAGASVPERSGDPPRYRAVIVGISCWNLRALLDGGVSSADLNSLLIGRYPEYFARIRSRDDSYHKRLSRARQDVRDLLASVIGRDELLP